MLALIERYKQKRVSKRKTKQFKYTKIMNDLDKIKRQKLFAYVD